MPDLSNEASLKFWQEFHDKTIYRVITFMEGVENFTYDEVPGIEEVVQKVGKALDNLSGVNMSALGHEEAFIEIGANIRTSRGLRMLQAIDTAHPGSASKVLMHAEERSQNPNDTAGLFIRRNIVFERLRLLSRIFEKKRVAFVLKVLSGGEQ